MHDKKRYGKNTITTAIVLTSLAGLPESGFSQDSLRIEEVIVTAQKREESLQETPISMAAFTSGDLQMKRIDSLQDLHTHVPNLNFTPHPNSANTALIYIRGIGLIDDQMTQDPSVGVYMDGVYLARAQGLSIDVADIERIEVLRGPQGTLYGRNTTGGAVNFISKPPSLDAMGFRQTVTLGNRDLMESKTSLNVPLNDSMAIKLALLRSLQDGFVSNEGSGTSDFGARDRTAFMVDLLWHPSDDVDIRYTYDQSKIKDSPAYLSLTPGGYDRGHRPHKGSPDVRDLRDNDNVTEGHTLAIAWDLVENLTFKSITSYRELDSKNYQDYLTGAVAPMPFFITDYSLDQRQFSQEFQMIGRSRNDSMRYVFGVYYFDEKARGFDLITVPMQNQVVNRIVDVNNKAYAVFGQLGYLPEMFDGRLEITLGGRWSRDERSAGMRQAYGTIGGMLFPSPAVGAGDNDYDNFSPSIVLSYNLLDDVNVYAKYVEGYKTGGFNIRASSIQRFNEGFDSEDLKSYEIGVKSRWLNGRLQANLAAFTADYDDVQVSTLSDPTNPSTSDILNAGKASIEGFEFDVLAVLTRNISLGVSYGYVDPDYDEIRTANGDDIAYLFRFVHVPRHSYAIDLNYEIEGLGIGDLRANISYSWQDKQVSDTSRNFGRRYGIESYGLLSGRVAYGGMDVLGGELEVAMWGKNLTDRKYLLVHLNPGLPAGIHGAPRAVGVDLTYRY